MAETKTQRSKPKKAATRKKATTKKATTTTRRSPAASRAKYAVDRTTELSDELLRSVEDGQRAAIEAVHKFVDSVDKVLPQRGAGPSRRQEIVDSALEMADKLVNTQYEFIRKVVDSAGKSLRR
jgi:molybdopterin biosynthesis enzyme MoaB